ncbi:hypothetical protein CK223_28840 [Mesorhizobium loti]|nr:hypothetical protein CK223_28840 [Mesorhizobium loti]
MRDPHLVDGQRGRQLRGHMTSDFSAARVHLDRAYHYLRGDDPMSQRGRGVGSIIDVGGSYSGMAAALQFRRAGARFQ